CAFCVFFFYFLLVSFLCMMNELSTIFSACAPGQSPRALDLHTLCWGVGRAPFAWEARFTCMDYIAMPHVRASCLLPGTWRENSYGQVKSSQVRSTFVTKGRLVLAYGRLTL
ncbi:unnamed protein product, partial [Discosporangium mesarthrocarpum]